MRIFSSVNSDNLMDFLLTAGKLKNIPRTGWVESGIENPESVADHSFRTALTVMVLSDYYELDTCKAVRMALLHDLGEADIGDITPMMKTEDHKESENKAMEKILTGLNESQRRLYWETWLEYQEKETPEAILAHDADKVEMLLQAFEYQSHFPYARMERFWDTAVSPMGKEILDKIKERKKAQP
jgi:putative hydrolase of HD superfamily